MKNLFVMALGLFWLSGCGSDKLTLESTKENLVGTWTLESLQENPEPAIEITISEEIIEYNGRTFFRASAGEGMFNGKLRGAALIRDEEKDRTHVVWVREVQKSESRPDGLDGESNMIRRIEDNSFILGGDFEDEDLFKMTKK